MLRVGNTNWVRGTDIRRDDPFTAIEVPYWIWKPLLDDIQKILADKLDEPSLTFIWPHIRDILRWCRCIVSGAGIEIIPDVLPAAQKRCI